MLIRPMKQAIVVDVNHLFKQKLKYTLLLLVIALFSFTQKVNAVACLPSDPDYCLWPIPCYDGDGYLGERACIANCLMSCVSPYYCGDGSVQNPPEVCDGSMSDQLCSIQDGDWTRTRTCTSSCTSISYGTCYVEACNTDYYQVGNSCVAVGIGYYSPDYNVYRFPCTNHPDTESRDYTYTTDGGGSNDCNATYTDKCPIDFYETTNGVCSTVGIGYYSPNLNNNRIACSNYPDTASRDYTYTSDGNGTNSCTATYAPLCGIDLYETVNGTCSAVWNGYYSPTANNTRTACSNYPDTASRDYTYTSDGNGTNSCTATYTDLCGIDLYESTNGVCSAVGIGHYSPTADNTDYSCTNKPSYSTYTSDGNGSNTCARSCNAGYHESGGTCVLNPSCGSSDGWTFYGTAPAGNLCTVGADSSVIANGSSWERGCTNGAQTANCTATRLYCGDANINGGEVCDDGGTSNSDGCNSSCTVEAGWSCNSGNPTLCSTFDDDVALWPVGLDTINVLWGSAISITKRTYNATSSCPSTAWAYTNTYTTSFSITSDAHNDEYICLYGEDGSSSITLASVNTLNIDATPPSVTFIDPVESWPVLSDTVTASRWDASIAKRTYNVGQSCPTNAGDYSYNSWVSMNQTTEANNGKYICLYAEDGIWNKVTLPSANAIYIDITGPTTTVADTSSDWRNENMITTLSCNDGAGAGCADRYYKVLPGDVSCTAGAYTTYTGSVSVTWADQEDTIKTLCYYATDTLNNSGSLNKQLYQIDKIPAVLSFTDEVGTGPALSDNIAMDYGDAVLAKWIYSTTASCPITPAAYLNTVAGTTTGFTIENEYQNTTYLCMYGEDRAGNVTTLASNNVINIDITGPSTSVADTSSGWRAADVMTTLACDDGVGIGCAESYYQIVSGDVSCGTGMYTLYSGSIAITWADAQNTTRTLCYYSVDNLDTMGAYNKQVYNIDKIFPKIYNVANKQIVNTSLLPIIVEDNYSWAILDSGVYISGTSITQTGNHILSIYDLAGNTRTVSFTIRIPVTWEALVSDYSQSEEKMIFRLASNSYPTTEMGISNFQLPYDEIVFTGEQYFEFGETWDVSIISDLYNIPVDSGTGIDLHSGVILATWVIFHPKAMYQLDLNSSSLVLFSSGNQVGYVSLFDGVRVLVESWWNTKLYPPVASWTTISFGGDEQDILFSKPIKIVLYNQSATPPYIIPQQKLAGWSQWYDIATVCTGHSIDTAPSNIALTGGHLECYANEWNNVVIWSHHAAEYQVVDNTPPYRIKIPATSSGGGSVYLKKDNCSSSSKTKLPGANKKAIDYSPSYYDNTCEWSDIQEENESKTQTQKEQETDLRVALLEKFHSSAAAECSIQYSPYSEELNNAYIYACREGITSMPAIWSANIEGELLRSHMAKMISVFAMKNLEKVPDTSQKECGYFRDIAGESAELQLAIKLSCQLWLMGLNSDGRSVQSNFNPNEVVTRAQFGTVLSRMIRGNKYNGNTQNWYIDHLNALKKEKIMTKIDEPFSLEMRWWVMLMLQRIGER